MFNRSCKLLLVIFLFAATPLLVQAFSVSAADEVFAAYNKIFWDPNAKQFREKSDSNQIESNFWMAAEELEMLQDVYDRTKSPDILKQCVDYYDGFTSPQRYGTDWTNLSPAGHYNDDMIWITIATLRMYEMTGDAKYKEQAKKVFDIVWERGWDDILGGGIHWAKDKDGKTACVNMPAGIAAVMLSDACNDEAYLNKAKQLYSWAREHLLDKHKRCVWDNKGNDGRIGKVCLTYNQGTYIGFAHLLYKKTKDVAYYNDANTALVFARKRFCHADSNTLGDESWCKDALGFKGIFIRYAARFAKEYNLTEYTNWLRENAQTVYNNRRSDGLTFTNFRSKCPDDAIAAWGATPGVIIMQTTVVSQ